MQSVNFLKLMKVQTIDTPACKFIYVVSAKITINVRMKKRESFLEDVNIL